MADMSHETALINIQTYNTGMYFTVDVLNINFKKN